MYRQTDRQINTYINRQIDRLIDRFKRNTLDTRPIHVLGISLEYLGAKPFLVVIFLTIFPMVS